MRNTSGMSEKIVQRISAEAIRVGSISKPLRQYLRGAETSPHIRPSRYPQYLHEQPLITNLRGPSSSTDLDTYRSTPPNFETSVGPSAQIH